MKKEGVFFKTVSKLTFGIYMLHVMFLEIIMNYVMPYSPSSALTPIIYMVITFVLIAPLSLFSAYLIGKAPYLGKLLYL